MWELCALSSSSTSWFYRKYFIFYRLAGSKPSDAQLKATGHHPFKFVIVRNPWNRLISVYIHKFLEISAYRSICKVSEYNKEFDR